MASQSIDNSPKAAKQAAEQSQTQSKGSLPNTDLASKGVLPTVDIAQELMHKVASLNSNYTVDGNVLRVDPRIHANEVGATSYIAKYARSGEVEKSNTERLSALLKLKTMGKIQFT